MKHWKISTLLALNLLTGCATTDVALSSPEKTEAGAGTLKLVWLFPNSGEIHLDGKRYIGEWSDSRCFTSQCRSEFFNVPKIHRRHIRRGSAELVAKDNTRLNCEWVSHDKEVIGTCRADDGRVFRLQAS
jgi:hypothetical protein